MHYLYCIPLCNLQRTVTSIAQYSASFLFLYAFVNFFPSFFLYKLIYNLSLNQRELESPGFFLHLGVSLSQSSYTFVLQKRWSKFPHLFVASFFVEMPLLKGHEGDPLSRATRANHQSVPMLNFPTRLSSCALKLRPSWFWLLWNLFEHCMVPKVI